MRLNTIVKQMKERKIQLVKLIEDAEDKSMVVEYTTVNQWEIKYNELNKEYCNICNMLNQYKG
jgi:hypothetical protein